MKLLKYGLVLLFSVTLWGCGKGNSSSVTIDPSTGKHATGWAVGSVGGKHIDAFLASSPAGASCEACHGKTDDLNGGISKVSCSTVSRSGMTCHPGVWPHGTGFGNPALHGAKVISNGMATCKKCHGNDYKGMPGLGVSCLGCHGTNAPHAIPWKGIAIGHKGFGGVGELNLPACADCHWGRDLGANTAKPGHIVPAGLKPSCNTGTGGATGVCHASAGHANPYIAPGAHGAVARLNLDGCAGCHATGTPPRFTLDKGNAQLAGNGCENCHNGGKTGLAHPYAWLPGRASTTTDFVNGGTALNTTTHATANFGAAGAQCSPCHTIIGTGVSPSPNAPSCMTQAAQIGSTTFCHFTADPVSNQTGCRSCHGGVTSNGTTTAPTGTVAPNRDYRHSKHFTKLPGLTCGVCHLGKGSGQTDHSTVDLSVATNAAKTAIPGLAAIPSYSEVAQGTYNSTTQTCANVSCHGGKALVGINFKWKGAGNLSADVGYCTSRCHTVSTVAPSAYAGSYIGPFSGYSSVINGGYQNLHQYHAASYTCAVCHDANVIHSRMLLGTRPINQAGFAKSSLKSIIGTYTVTSTIQNTSTCASISCHADSTVRSWYKN